VKHNVIYKFLVLNNDTIEHNIIIETKNIELFECVFSLQLLVMSYCEDLKNKR